MARGETLLEPVRRCSRVSSTVVGWNSEQFRMITDWKGALTSPPQQAAGGVERLRA